jgi:4-diphosphocytidyl-2C-methyl-D-erythritol kinase
MKEIDETKINRIEVINHASNDYHACKLLTLYQKLVHFDDIEISIQDEGETLKIFLTK